MSSTENFFGRWYEFESKDLEKVKQIANRVGNREHFEMDLEKEGICFYYDLFMTMEDWENEHASNEN